MWGSNQTQTVVIFVKTVGTLNSLAEGAKFLPLDVPEGTSVSQVMERLHVEDWEVGFVLINKNRATVESLLQDQDRLTLIAPLVGG